MGVVLRFALVCSVVGGMATAATAAAPGDEPATTTPPEGETSTDADEGAKPKEPGRGDFDAGGQVRFPSGPDEMGEYATWNWVAVDMVGRYFLLDSVTINGTMPVALIKPEDVGGIEPRMIGGMTVSLEAKLPKMPMQPKAYEGDVSLVLTGVYMREGALLLSKNDYPLFVGDFKPGFAAGITTKIKLSTLVDFSMTPVYAYQSGTTESLTALQLPMSLILGVGSLAKVSADLGIFTGDDISFRGKNGGRLAAGGSLTLKIGPILAHAGAGVASLLTGGLYPTIRDSVYIDVNVKYAK
jgi:hypothetical protein